LADEALKLYDSQALRDFVGIDLSRQSVPDATTLLKLRGNGQPPTHRHGRKHGIAGQLDPLPAKADDVTV
jgi:hypothetical protein